MTPRSRRACHRSFDRGDRTDYRFGNRRFGAWRAEMIPPSSTERTAAVPSSAPGGRHEPLPGTQITSLSAPGDDATAAPHHPAPTCTTTRRSR